MWRASQPSCAIGNSAYFDGLSTHVGLPPVQRLGSLMTLVVSWVVALLADLALAQVGVPAGVALVLALLALHGANVLLRRLGASMLVCLQDVDEVSHGG